MISFFSYLRFLILSKKRHGLHSPFVYSYVTNCLLKRDMCQKKVLGRTARIVLKSIAYFDARNLWVRPGDGQLQLSILKENTPSSFDISPFDLMYVEHPDDPLLHSHDLPQCTHNNSLIIIDNIYKTSRNNALWKSHYQSEKYPVTMDLYHCGILFFRSGQAKEHFRIRI